MQLSYRSKSGYALPASLQQISYQHIQPMGLRRFSVYGYDICIASFYEKKEVSADFSWNALTSEAFFKKVATINTNQERLRYELNIKIAILKRQFWFIQMTAETFITIVANVFQW